MFSKSKNENTKKNTQYLNIKLALIYILLVLLFISILLLL
jgi:competence protein ComGC